MSLISCLKKGVITLRGYEPYFSSDPPESPVTAKANVWRLTSLPTSEGRVPEDVEGRVREREASC